VIHSEEVHSIGPNLGHASVSQSPRYQADFTDLFGLEQKPKRSHDCPDMKPVYLLRLTRMTKKCPRVDKK
jgi:hypothetical protein